MEIVIRTIEVIAGLIIVVLQFVQNPSQYRWYVIGLVGIIAVCSVALQFIQKKQRKLWEDGQIERQRTTDAKIEQVVAAIGRVSIDIKPAAAVLPPPPVEAATGADVAAKFIRAHLVNAYPFANLLDGIYKAAGRTDYEVESDFLFEIFLVNKSDVTVTIEKYLAEAEIVGVWTELKQMTDVADYQLDFGEEQHLPMGSFNKYEDLSNLYEQLKGVPLVKGVGYKGWLRFRLTSEKQNVEGQTIQHKVTLIDALGGKHPVLLEGPLDKSGEVRFNPDRVRKWLKEA